MEVHRYNRVIRVQWLGRSLGKVRAYCVALRMKSPTLVCSRSLPQSVVMLADETLRECLISSAAAEALREGSEGNAPECGPHDAASFFGRHSSERRSHKKHVSSESVACPCCDQSPQP